MRRLPALLAILLLLTTASPMLACVAGGSMTTQESACCRSMHGQCGDMAGTRCCQPQSQTDNHPQLAATTPSTEIHWTHWIACADSAYLSPSLPRLAQASLRAPEHHPPPLLRTLETIVLRI